MHKTDREKKLEWLENNWYDVHIESGWTTLFRCIHLRCEMLFKDPAPAAQHTATILLSDNVYRTFSQLFPTFCSIHFQKMFHPNGCSRCESACLPACEFERKELEFSVEMLDCSSNPRLWNSISVKYKLLLRSFSRSLPFFLNLCRCMSVCARANAIHSFYIGTLFAHLGPIEIRFHSNTHIPKMLNRIFKELKCIAWFSILIKALMHTFGLSNHFSPYQKSVNRTKSTEI